MVIPTADAGSDQTFAFSALPTSANLTGSGSGGTIVSYLWEILEKPAGSAATLSSTTAQNPTLQNVDTPGTYMMFLVVTNSDPNTSDDNPLTAPPSARVHVNVRSQYAELIKPAPGERGWEGKYWEAIDEIDSLRQEVDAFECAEGVFAANVIGTRLASGFNPLIVDVPQVTNESKAACYWRCGCNTYIDSFAVQLADAGELGAQWTISAYAVTPAEFESNTYAGGSQIATKNITASAAHGPEAEIVILGTPGEVDAGEILAVLVENAPLQNGPPAKEPGTGLGISMRWRLRL
jgi:hypothetical protein